MSENQNGVDYLKKIGLAVAAGSTQKDVDLAGKPSNLSFIYGVGTEGITLFEKALFAKLPGDEVMIEVQPHQTDDLLGHLKPSIEGIAPESDTSYFLKVRIESVDTPDQREIIRAIAEGVASDGCDCGCGCGC
jgi:hypothetical protein